MNLTIALRVLTIASWLALAGAAWGGSNPALSAQVNGVRDPAHAMALQLRRLDVRVEVHGAIAEAVVDAVFANPTADMLEGDFRYTLPQGAVVTGYALDVRGAMVDGVLVDHPRAKALYEARVRRGVDPGLAEVKPGNVFETHVHPIFPGGGRHIRLTFAFAIPADGARLPFDIAAPLDGWSVEVKGDGAAALVGAEAGRREGDRWSAPANGAPLAAELALTRASPPATLLTRHRTGEWDVQLSGALPPPAPTAEPQRLRIYWDRSRSRLSSRLESDLALVRAVIERARPRTIELVAFNSTGALRAEARDADGAVAWLKALTLRGAASYAALGAEAPTDRCLLFSRGGPSLDLEAGFSPPCRLDAVASAPDADLVWLRHAAEAHGGGAQVLTEANLAQLAESLARPYRGVVALQDRDGRDLPFIPLQTDPDHWLVLARAPEGGGVTVMLTDGVTRQGLARSLPAEGADFDAPGALLAADRLALLTAPAQREAFVALSRRYGVASASLSFLVLETPQDYLAAGIEPPAGFPAEWRDDYLRWRKHAATEAECARAARLTEVVSEWQDEVRWWQTKFDPAARPKRVAVSDHFDRTAAPAQPRPLPAALPPPPPPPPPPAPMASPASAPPAVRGGATELIVTAERRRAGYQAAAAKDAPEAADGVAIQIDAWQPDRPYLENYDGKPADFDARFLEAEARHGALPIFYLDTAEWLRRHGRVGEATEMVLASLDLDTSDGVTLSIVADRLERYGAWDRAVELRERAVILDPDRQQPKRLLALTLARRAAHQGAHAREDLTRAISLLYTIAISPVPDGRQGLELVALNEANALLPRLKALGGTVAMDPRLVALLDVDLRVTLDWTSDASDMDLWVDEPTGERAIYNNNRTAIGGHLSRDMTQGYGPEEYLLRRAISGVYKVQANVYAPDRIDPNGATLITAHIIRDFGRPTEHEESVDVELKRDEQGSKMIGTVEVRKSTPVTR
jgi:Vault protein inter-alpha-trypsin domain